MLGCGGKGSRKRLWDQILDGLEHVLRSQVSSQFVHSSIHATDTNRVSAVSRAWSKVPHNGVVVTSADTVECGLKSFL